MCVFVFYFNQVVWTFHCTFLVFFFSLYFFLFVLYKWIYLFCVFILIFLFMFFIFLEQLFLFPLVIRLSFATWSCRGIEFSLCLYRSMVAINWLRIAAVVGRMKVFPIVPEGTTDVIFLIYYITLWMSNFI